MKSRNLVCISDTHVGCQFGLCHPKGARLDGGGVYRPTKLQKQIWRYWQAFGNWITAATKGEEYAVLINGDILDNVHHNSTHQWSHNLEDQAAHAYMILAPFVDKCEELYIVRGTPVHSGESAVEEERLAKRLGAKPTKDGCYSRNDLWLQMGRHIIHAAHHIGTTSSSAHETSAVNAELTALFTESGRWGHKPPSIIVRSHRHRCSEIKLPAEHCSATAFVTAAWQVKTPYAYKCASGRTSTPQIGGSLIRLSDELHTRHKVWDVGRGDVE